MGSLNYFVLWILFLLLPVGGLFAQDDYAENFDGSESENTSIEEIEVEEGIPKEIPAPKESFGISLGELKETTRNKEMAEESLAAMEAAQKAREEEMGKKLEAAIKSLKPTKSDSGLELTDAEVFPAGI
jgi:hypothetical protein